MLRAGSLIYAIAIALILAILSSSIILLAFNARTAVESNFIGEKQISNVSSALNYYLTNDDLLQPGEKRTVDLFQQGSDSVELKKKAWGLFEVLYCNAHQGYKSETGIFLVGDKPSKNLTALYMGDQNKPLALCGQTLIKGSSYIPVQGAKRAYIEGQSFIGDKLIDGTIQNSSSILPSFSKSIVTDFIAITSISADDSMMDIVLAQTKTMSNSFNNRTLILVSNTDITLENCQFTGNIVIRSSGQIKVNSGAILNGVLIEAASIVVEDRSSIEFQGFATDSIIIGANCKINYPSSLCILDDKAHKKDSKIVIGQNTNISGNIINFNSHDITDKSVNINLSAGCVVNGLLYSSSYISFNGIVNGSLYAAGFILKTPSAVYENHLLNVTVNANTLPDNFVGTFIPSDIKRKALIKTLE